MHTLAQDGDQKHNHPIDKILIRIIIRILNHKIELQRWRTLLTKFMQISIENKKSTDAAIKNLKNQVGQIAKQLADQQGGMFITSTQTNPKEH